MSLLLATSAVLAWLHREPGADQVVQALASPVTCRVTAANQTEIIAKCLDRGVAGEETLPMLTAPGYSVVAQTEEDGVRVGQLRPLTRRLGLSLGDRLCLAAAQRLGSRVLTADRPWLEMAQPLGLEIVCVRPEMQ